MTIDYHLDMISEMNLQTKALYNLLKLNHACDPSISCEDWQIEDLRSLPNEKIFSRLEAFGISLDRLRFDQFAKEADAPEALTELLLEDSQDLKKHDPVYLLIFELWRRFLPERQTISVFCDELDERISRYDEGQEETDEPIQDALANLMEILDENVDLGSNPIDVFRAVSSYSAHDLMGFILDYIADLLDSGNQIYASELIEDFSYYSRDTIWFDFLRTRLTAFSDPIKANEMIGQLLGHDEQLSIDLLFEILRFQTSYGERDIFAQVVKKILTRITTEEEFHELLEFMAEYFHRRDREDLESSVRQMIQARHRRKGSFSLSEPEIQKLEKLYRS